MSNGNIIDLLKQNWNYWPSRSTWKTTMRYSIPWAARVPGFVRKAQCGEIDRHPGVDVSRVGFGTLRPHRHALKIGDAQEIRRLVNVTGLYFGRSRFASKTCSFNSSSIAPQAFG
jgi:hypothetical protein